VKEYLTANRALWDAWTPFHVRSKFYDVDAFKAGAETLDAIEIAGVGDIRGKRLLHLQCHFGMDTLSWARRGAKTIGTDFSANAIEAARALAAETGIEAHFVQSDLYELPSTINERFDVVFASHGVLGWLPDLERWAGVVAHFLVPGGVFYLVEVHPFALLFDERRDDGEFRLAHPYFHRAEPIASQESGTYAAPGAPVAGTAYYWNHALSDVVGALLRAGLIIDALEEYPFMGWAHFPRMTQRPDGFWELPGGRPDIPLMFSLRATTAG